MKLFVDDNRPAPPGWRLARTVGEALALLESETCTEVSLDYLAQGGATFLPVAARIAGLPDGRRPAVVRLHTSSEVGAREMARLLEGRGIRVEGI
jgi:hypothetical protein